MDDTTRNQGETPEREFEKTEKEAVSKIGKKGGQSQTKEDERLEREDEGEY